MKSGNKSGRPSNLERLRLLQKSGGSFDQTYYRNDEELKNVFSSEHSSASSQTKINTDSLSSTTTRNIEKAVAAPRHSLRSQESLESVDWNDFQGSTLDDVIVEDEAASTNLTHLGQINEQIRNEEDAKNLPPVDISKIFTNISNISRKVEENQTKRSMIDSENGEIEDDNEFDKHESLEDDEEEEEEEEEMSENLLLNDDDESNAMLFGKVQQMEAEQDLLSNSLLALTSHFAQVQLRLRQIVEAKDVPVEKREVLLQELESFANRGIPELMMTMAPQRSHTGERGGTLERSVSMATSFTADDVFDDGGEDFEEEEEESIVVSTINAGPSDHEKMSTLPDAARGSYSVRSLGRSRGSPKNSTSSMGADDQRSETQSGGGHRSRIESSSTTAWITEEKLERQRNRQKELIGQLKEQLEDLEKYAYETGEMSVLPSSMLLERQNAIIEQLKSKLPVLTIDEIDKLGPEELRKKVDFAVKEVTIHKLNYSEV